MTVGQPEGYLAVPETRKGPGVLVLHAWWGLNPFFKDLCNQLAREGFVVFAPDLYHGKLATTIEEADHLSNTLKEESARADIDSAIEYLQSLEAVTSSALGMVGFSLGAYYAIRASCDRPKDIKAVVLFYGTGSGDYASAQAAYLGHFAETDPYESPSDVKRFEEQLRAAHRPVTFHTYAGTGHWFFEKDRADAYQQKAAELAWERTVAFLRTTLAPSKDKVRSPQ
jgi:carboxymethylenebutenolidase